MTFRPLYESFNFLVVLGTMPEKNKTVLPDTFVSISCAVVSLIMFLILAIVVVMALKTGELLLIKGQGNRILLTETPTVYWTALALHVWFVLGFVWFFFSSVKIARKIKRKQS